MDKNIVRAIIYSKFDQKAGPTAIAWIPADLSTDIRNLVSLKTIQVLAGESGKLPKSLAIIPFPSIESKGLVKGLVKYVEIVDLMSRGRAIDSSITLLFNETDDLIFYKYVKDFEAIFDEFAKKIIHLEEEKAGTEKIGQEIIIFQKKVGDILGELKKSETSTKDSAAFPTETEGTSKFREMRYKLIVVGDPEVGKTSTILRFTDNAFRRTYNPTIGVNLSDKLLRYKDEAIKFVLWDIAGQSKFRMMRGHFYKGADGLLLIFDLTSPESLANISNWYEDVKIHIQADLPGLLLGNKNDLIDQRKVQRTEGESVAKALNLEYYETSALTGENIAACFLKMAEKLHEIKIGRRDKEATKQKIKPAPKKRKPSAKKSNQSKISKAKKQTTKKRSATKLKE